MTGVQFSVGLTIEFFLFNIAFRPVLGPTQPPIQLGTGRSFLGSYTGGAWNWLLTYLVLRIRMPGAI